MERRVRKVRLAAASRPLVQRGALLLEDAMRTASLPEAPGGRVLLVRSLELGRIRADQSPASLSLIVERRVRALEHLAVHAEEASAPTAPAVYFRDPVEPFVMLATRLARSQPVDAWFWPLAVPGLRPGMPREEALRLVLAGALRTEPGPAAAILLVAELSAQGALDPLLASLDWQDGPALVQTWWGFQPPLPGAFLLMGTPGPEQQLAAPLRAEVSRWATAWGHGDARSLWLTAVALCMGRLTRAADPELPAQAWQVLGALHAVGRGVPTPPAPSPLPSGAAPASALREAAAAAPPPHTPRRDSQTERPDLPGAKSPAPGPEETRRGATGSEPPSNGPKSSSPLSPRDSRDSSPRGSHAPSPSVPEASHPVAPSAPPPPTVQRLPTASEATTPPPGLPFLTTAGGLLFLIPVLEYLGIRELFAAFPALLEHSFPERFLLHVATRLGVPPADPLLIALRAATPPPASSCPFVLTARFRERVAAREPFHLLQEPSGRHITLDAHERIPLAVTHHEGPVPPPAAGLYAQAVESPLPWDDFTLLLRAFQLGTGRICRTRAHLGLRGLVLRPGRFVTTRTHLDVIFDPGQVDLRIRRAGLDIDPGWVPWLTRVIRYHYVDDESVGE